MILKSTGEVKNVQEDELDNEKGLSTIFLFDYATSNYTLKQKKGLILYWLNV